jgi:glycosyltransferase involved in cell wall biosynthesis
MRRISPRRPIYHGLPRDLLHFSSGADKYLAFLGRISPEKRPDIAIEVARRVGIPLKIAAKVDVVDRDYYEAMGEATPVSARDRVYRRNQRIRKERVPR